MLPLPLDGACLHDARQEGGEGSMCGRAGGGAGHACRGGFVMDVEETDTWRELIVVVCAIKKS